jgi:hypothetical protein
MPRDTAARSLWKLNANAAVSDDRVKIEQAKAGRRREQRVSADVFPNSLPHDRDHTGRPLRLPCEKSTATGFFLNASLGNEERLQRH